MPALYADIEGRPDAERLSDLAPLRFSDAGELLTRSRKSALRFAFATSFASALTQS